MRVPTLAILVIWASPALLLANSFDYSRVEHAIAQRDFAWAQQALEQHLAADTSDYRAHMLLGIVLDELSRPSEAADHLEEAVKLQPRSPAAHINLGKHEARAGDFIRATREFEAAIQLDPRDASAHTNLGLLLTAQGKNDLALPEFQEAAQSGGDDPAAWLNLFKCQLSLKQYSAARATANKVFSLASPSAVLFGQLGALQAQAGDYSGAIDNLERSATMDAHAFEPRYNLGLAYYHTGNLARASEMLAALEKEHANAEVENLLGEVYEHQQEHLAAVRAFQKAAELDPSSEAYRFDYIQELLAHRNYAAAIMVAKPAVRDFPGSSRIALALGVAYFGGGHERESMDVFLTAAQTFQDQKLPLYFLGLAADTTQQNLPETERLTETYARRHPDDYWPYYFLGHRAYEAARTSGSEEGFKRARDLLSRSIALGGDRADAHLDLGSVEAHFHEWSAAIREFQKAVQLEPDLAEAHFRLSQAYAKTGNASKSEEQAEIHKRLLAQKTEKDANRRVEVFVYELSH